MYYTNNWKYENDGLISINFPDDDFEEAKMDETGDITRFMDKTMIRRLIKRYSEEKGEDLRSDENVFISYYTTDELIEGSNRKRYFLEPRSGRLTRMSMIRKIYDILRDSFLTDIIDNFHKTGPFHEAYDINFFNLRFIIIIGFYDMRSCIDFACDNFLELLETFRYSSVTNAIDRSKNLCSFYYRFISSNSKQTVEYFVLVEFSDIYSRITSNFNPPIALDMHPEIYSLVRNSIRDAVNMNRKSIKFEDVKLQLGGLYEEKTVEKMVNVAVKFINNNVVLEPMTVHKEDLGVYKINRTLKHYEDIENDYFHYNIPYDSDELRCVLDKLQEKFDDITKIKPINYCNEFISLNDRYKVINVMKKYNKNIKYNNAMVYLFAQHYLKYETIQERIKMPIEVRAINVIMTAVKKILGLVKYNINQCLMRNPRAKFINTTNDISKYSIRILDDSSGQLFYMKPSEETFRTGSKLEFSHEQSLHNIRNNTKSDSENSLNFFDD
uniref:p55 C-terminal domain-containing protein n=1 Tax=Emaravirus tritici TaxID=1980428 RepID=A0A650E782_9VIRU|nr:P6 hypothetical protein [Emaravirus tritici]